MGLGWRGQCAVANMAHYLLAWALLRVGLGNFGFLRVVFSIPRNLQASTSNACACVFACVRGGVCVGVFACALRATAACLPIGPAG